MRRDHTGFDGERANPGDHVAAIRRGIDQALLNPDLGEQVVDVGTRNPRWTDDRNLAGERMSAADPVYLRRFPAPIAETSKLVRVSLGKAKRGSKRSPAGQRDVRGRDNSL